MSKINTKTSSIDMNTQSVDVALTSSFLTYYIFNLIYFASCSIDSYVDFKLVNVGWEFY